ncbi:MAG: DUF5071 domain-containing protein, partial [Myxococcales bacterium]|nr:DUF5071 domain-containing protein [Myxococcales bacterium]
MAWIHSLSLECRTPDNAQRVADALARVERPAPESAAEGNVTTQHNWVVLPIPNHQAIIESTYQLLRATPLDFRYGLIGLEVDEFRTYDELRSEPLAALCTFRGLLLDRSLFEHLGSPSALQPFNDTHYWVPWASDAQLRRLYPDHPELNADALHLLPSTKSDFAALLRLRGAPADQTAALVGPMLTWLQDPNWPIFRDVVEWLEARLDETVEPLREVLEGTDFVWID